jgi:tetratricopeptide (TPR) repeat protein
MKKEVYRKYFGATWGRFYSLEQRERLLELFASAHGALTEGGVVPEIKRTVEQIESFRLTNLIECRNLILIFNVQGEEGDLMIALGVLQDLIENRRAAGEAVYVTARDWHMAVYDERKPLALEQAFIACSDGDYEQAIKILEKQNESLETVEYLAVLHSEQGNAEKAYYYLNRLSYLLCDRLHLEAPEWVGDEIRRLGTLLPPEAKEALDRKICLAAANSRVPMGFIA